MTAAVPIFPEPLGGVLLPLFRALPPARAMTALVVKGAPLADPLRSLAAAAVAHPAIAGKPAVQAGIWLYVDGLDRSHAISQGMEDATGAFWHGIMHRREGDFSNSHYWFRRAGAHPAIKAMPNYDPHAFIDAVAAAQPADPQELVQVQQSEWLGLMRWCATQAPDAE